MKCKRPICYVSTITTTKQEGQETVARKENRTGFDGGSHYRILEELEEIQLSHGPRDSVVRKRSLIGSSTIPHITGFSQAIFPPSSSVERHVHESKFETFFCKEGTGKFVIGAAEQPSAADEVLDLRPGACVTVSPTFYHSIENTGEVDMVLLYFGVAV